MTEVKDLASSALKWSRNASNASADYGDRAANAGEIWQRNTVAARQTFQQAITAPGIPERYSRGVQRAGAQKYSQRVRDLGQERYSTGVAAAQDDWQSGFSPYAQAIRGVTLTPRRPRGDRSNLQRVAEIANRLHAVRLGQLGQSST